MYYPRAAFYTYHCAIAVRLQNCHQAKIGLHLRSTLYVSCVSLPRHMPMSQLSGPCPHASLSYSRSQAPRVSKAWCCSQRFRAVAAVVKDPAQQTIRIKLKAYELPLLKQSVQQIVTTANSNGMTLSSVTSCHQFQASNLCVHELCVQQQQHSVPNADNLTSSPVVQRPIYLDQYLCQLGFASTQY